MSVQICICFLIALKSSTPDARIPFLAAFPYKILNSSGLEHPIEHPRQAGIVRGSWQFNQNKHQNLKEPDQL